MGDFEIDDFFGNDNLGDEPTVEEEEDRENAVDSLFAEEKKEDLAKKKPKRKIPDAARFNEALLMGPKGIKHLSELCQTFKFDQKAGPYQNLENVMKLYQHWAHVMYPKFKFEDTVAQCEKLGGKRAIKIYMERMRQGMTMSPEEFDQLHGKSNEREEDEERTMELDTFSKSIFAEESTDQYPEPSTKPKSNQVDEPVAASAPRVLTEEERRKVAENRLRALQIREQKQKEKELAAKMAEEEEARYAEVAEEAVLVDVSPPPEAMQDEMLDEENIMNELGF
ncbi:unnamed protein product, partial [Mesorhabditis belari]|uniref:TIMELESS-interacting protein n=1 Tax=Mesorhabditis belari TaxID=2138241 RepID=A0AAF3F5W7_9BILA